MYIVVSPICWGKARLLNGIRGVSKIATPSGTQEMTVINESGLYSLLVLPKVATI